MRAIAIIAVVAFLLLSPNFAHAELKTEPLEYKQGETVLKGYLAYDDAISVRRPGILLVHEWWGLNDYSRSRARQVAALGYVVLAVDMYGNGAAVNTVPEASKLAGELRQHPDVAKARILAALEKLRNTTNVDPARVAVMGYCFGGTVALDLARTGADLRGAVSFHGGLETPNLAQPNTIKAKILVMTGADDPNVPMTQLNAFIDEMKKAGANYEVDVYSGAVHAFTNPDADKYGIPGIGYNRQADERSWERMKAFFVEVFK